MVPDYYKSPIHTARVHHGSGADPLSASELEGLGIGDGQEAQGTSERRVTHTRKISAPPRAPGDELQ
jgi:hypothetical protein